MSAAEAFTESFSEMLPSMAGAHAEICGNPGEIL
jgi:hypothetical protein